MRKILRKYYEFGPVVHEMYFKNSSNPELWPPFCSAERNHLCNFGRGHQKEQFCEIILNLDQWFRMRCHLKDFLSGGLAGLLFVRAEPYVHF